MRARSGNGSSVCIGSGSEEHREVKCITKSAQPNQEGALVGMVQRSTTAVGRMSGCLHDSFCPCTHFEYRSESA